MWNYLYIGGGIKRRAKEVGCGVSTVYKALDETHSQYILNDMNKVLNNIKNGA